MVSPTAAGRTDSPTTSHQRYCPMSIGTWSGMASTTGVGLEDVFGPLGRHSGACEELAANLRRLGQARAARGQGVSFRLPLTRPPSSPDKPWSSMAAYRARRRAQSLIISPQQSVTEV
jgi:hypothetical protein